MGNLIEKIKYWKYQYLIDNNIRAQRERESLIYIFYKDCQPEHLSISNDM